jgi:hypothetical protein
VSFSKIGHSLVHANLFGSRLKIQTFLDFNDSMHLAIVEFFIFSLLKTAIPSNGERESRFVVVGMPGQDNPVVGHPATYGDNMLEHIRM